MRHDESDLIVPASYQPMSSKEADEACSYDYDFVDLRTTDELERDLDTILANMATGGKRLF